MMERESTVYRIREWDKHFENHESRKVKTLAWVPVKNKHDGAGYRRIISLPNGAEVFAAWILMLQIASKMPVRGVLQNEEGPLDSLDMAVMTGLPASIFDSAIEALMHPRVRWLEQCEQSEPEVSGRSRATRLYLMRNGRNGMTKIGISDEPRAREKTLQSEEPEIELLHHWMGSRTLERQLHEQFKSKRVRGEWFNLSSDDVREIVEAMNGGNGDGQ